MEKIYHLKKKTETIAERKSRLAKRRKNYMKERERNMIRKGIDYLKLIRTREMRVKLLNRQNKAI